MNMAVYADWEDQVTVLIEVKLELTRSDAQAVVEGQHNVITQAWTRGLTPEVAAERVIQASSVS
jgi:hypothetical protein